MEAFIFFGLGFILGILVMTVFLKDSNNTNAVLKDTINSLQKDLEDANFKIEQRNNFIKDYQEEHEILLKNASELRARIRDLENNLELVTNDSNNDKIIELVSDDQSQN